MQQGLRRRNAGGKAGRAARFSRFLSRWPLGAARRRAFGRGVLVGASLLT
jgi:hypothetical protein